MHALMPHKCVLHVHCVNTLSWVVQENYQNKISFLLKGENWKGNKGAGLVHRSPHQDGKYNRLYMTIDFLDTYISIYKNSLKY